MSDIKNETAYEMTIKLHSGMPDKDGWYLVKLINGRTHGDKKYDVDYCRAKSPSDGKGREWVNWYPHNISHYASLE